MTVKVTKYRVDDLEEAKKPGAEVPADRTMRFSIDGTEYEIDLSGRNADKFAKQLQPYTEAGRRIRGRGRSRPVSSRQQTAGIREWARSRGYSVSDKGRIPAKVLSEYAASKAA